MMNATGQDRNRFLDYMNEKARSIGMKNSCFVDPVGMRNTSTALDVMKLLVFASKCQDLQPIWGMVEHDVKVSGPESREFKVTSTFAGSHLKDHYSIVGGKTGTLRKQNARNLAVILEIPGSSEQLAVAVLYANGMDDEPDSRFDAVRQAADAALAKWKDPSVDMTSFHVGCDCAAACLVPKGDYDPDKLELLYAKNETMEKMPASITKILTTICVLDIQPDMKQEFTFEEEDTEIGTYYRDEFFPGETVTFEEAFYSMMLPSINVSANAVARRAGRLLLEEEM